MKTVVITPEEMNRRTVRFKALESYQHQQEKLAGIPAAVLEKIAAHRVYPMMIPASYSGRSAQAPLKGADGLALTIAECPPGDGPALHCHERTIENFLCLNGRFKISWGDRGEHSLILEPLDLCSMPPGVNRCFTNISDETARLLVMIQIPTVEQADRITYAAQTGTEIAEQYGNDAVEALAKIGIRFDAGRDTA